MYLPVCSGPTHRAGTDSNQTYAAPMQLVVGSRPSHKADRGTDFCAVSSLFSSLLQADSLRTSQRKHRQMRTRMQLLDDSVPTHKIGTDFSRVSSLIKAYSLCSYAVSSLIKAHNRPLTRPASLFKAYSKQAHTSKGTDVYAVSSLLKASLLTSLLKAFSQCRHGLLCN